MKAERTCILVLGPHRSGTSSMAGVLHHLGVPLGDRMLPPAADNPTGYWEHEAVYELHERLLGDIGASWDVGSLPDGWETTSAAKRATDEIRRFALSQFGRRSLWAVKDPRLCHVLPVWQAALRQLECRPHYLIMVRDPREVARSLEARNGLSSEESYSIWLGHHLAAEAHTRGASRVFSSYAALLEDWRREVDRISSHLGVSWPRAAATAGRRIDAYLRPDLRHHHEQEEISEASVDPPLGRAYSLLRKRCTRSGRPNVRGLDAIRKSFHEEPRSGRRTLLEGLRRSHALRSRIEGLEKGVDELRTARERLQVHSNNLAEELAGQLQHTGTLEQQLAEARRSASAGAEALRSRDAELAALARSLADANEHERTLQEEKEQLARDLAAARELAADRKAEIGRLLRQVDELQRASDRLAEVLASRSWRFTAPVRALKSRASHLLQYSRHRASMAVGSSPQARAAARRPARERVEVDSPEPAARLFWHIETFQQSVDSFGLDVFLVAGWCFRTGSREPVRLELRADGQRVLRISCGEVRDDVAVAHGAHLGSSSLPRCGFRAHLFLAVSMRVLELRSPHDGQVLATFEVPEDFHARRGAQLQALRPPRAPSTGSAFDPYAAWIEANRPGTRVRELMRAAGARDTAGPKFSILMSVAGADAAQVEATIESVRAQAYGSWELCIAADASIGRDARVVLERDRADPRVRIADPTGSGELSEVSNAAAALATGDFVVLAGCGDQLSEDALLEYARCLRESPRTDVLYCDEDELGPRGERRAGHFKPDWSPVLFRGYDYIGRFAGIRRALLVDVGGFRPGFGGARDYDLLLRITSRTDRIVHVPRLLCHRRAPAGPDVDPTASRSVDRAIRDSLERDGIAAAELYAPGLAAKHVPPVRQLDWPDEGPKVTVVIPTRNQAALLERCLDTLVGKTTYRSFDVLVVDNGSDDPQTLEYLESIPGDRLRVVRIPNGPRGFSFSHVNNQAVRSASSELVLFLNDDTEVIEPRWLSRMAGYAGLPGVGAVGARLLYPDGSVQHGGVVLRGNDLGLPGHAFAGQPSREASYGALAETAREVVAVTGACLLTPRALFEECGGFDERSFGVSLNDVDYCLRLADRGLRTVYVGGAVLLHHESRSRSRQDDPAEPAAFKRRYRDRADPYYNPNFSRRRPFEVDPGYHGSHLALAEGPVRAVLVVPSLRLEGGPKILTESARRLAERGRFQPVVLAFGDGELRAGLEASGIECHVQELPRLPNALGTFHDPGHLEECVSAVAGALDRLRAEVALAATVHSFFVVEAAFRQGVPALWFVQESYSESVLRRVVQPFSWAMWRRALAKAAGVVFGSRETASFYEPFRESTNFEVLYNHVDLHGVDAYCRDVSRVEARERLGVPDGKTLVVSVGNVCSRKDQATTLEAVRKLVRHRADFAVHLVGAREEEAYVATVRALVERWGLEEWVRIVGETGNVYEHLRAADVFASSSLIESYSYAILEAMAFGLPIVASAAPGVREQVRPGINGRVFQPGDATAMAELLEGMISDEAGRAELGRSSRHLIETMPDPGEATRELERLMEGAWVRGVTV